MNDNKIKSVVVDDGVYNFFDVGKNCDHIEYHVPLGEGDRHYVDITAKGKRTRYFIIIKITEEL
jgi:hypothetical protein